MPRVSLAAITTLSPVANVPDPEELLRTITGDFSGLLKAASSCNLGSGSVWESCSGTDIGRPSPSEECLSPRGGLVAAVAALPPAENIPTPGGKPVAASASLPPAEVFPDLGRKMAAKTALPQGTFLETDLAIMVASLPAEMFSDPEGMSMTPAPDG